MSNLNRENMNEDQIKNLLKSHGIKPSDKLGQNFLVDEYTLSDIVDAAKVKKTDFVLEIGPGVGNLTERLVEKAGFVFGIEKDDRMYPFLRQLQKKHKNFEFIIDDALKYDYAQNLPEKMDSFSSFKVVANIPYYITGKLVQLFLALEPKPSSITLLVQEEVARNLTAKPGKLNLLAISVQLFGNPRYALSVPAKSFFPTPKVDSAVITIDVPSKPPYQVKNEKLLFRVLKACFMGKRKQIHNTLKNNLGMKSEEVSKMLEKLGISPQDRPQHLSIQSWLDLAREIDSKT